MEIGNIDWRYIVDSFYYWMMLDLLLIWLLGYNWIENIDNE